MKRKHLNQVGQSRRVRRNEWPPRGRDVNRETLFALIGQRDARALRAAARSYGDSWRKRGGVGAFMMLARKWDRLELSAARAAWDIFRAIRTDRRAEGVIDDIRDLRRYLILVESEMILRGVVV